MVKLTKKPYTVKYNYLVGVEATFHHTVIQNVNDNQQSSSVTTDAVHFSPRHQIYNNILAHIAYTTLIHKVTGDKINKLSYTGQDCVRIPDGLARLYGSKVQILDLSFNALISLRGLEHFKIINELILDNNDLSDNIQIPFLPFLHTLSLNKNNIFNLEELIQQISEKLPALTYLSLLGNKACPDQLTDVEKDENDYQRYRYYVLHKLPNLKFLDSRRVLDTERTEALKRGKFLKVVRPNNKDQESTVHSSEILKNYSPLPSSQRLLNEHKGAYGKCRYRYSGKHSEGNRFIRNSDL